MEYFVDFTENGNFYFCSFDDFNSAADFAEEVHGTLYDWEGKEY